MARILVIEDDPDTREAVESTLQADGHEVRVARDGREGLILHSLDRADLIITDILMPSADGLDVIVQLRQAHDPVRILVMTAYSRQGTAFLTAMQLGADSSLTKPFSPAELRAAVKRTLLPRSA